MMVEPFGWECFNKTITFKAQVISKSIFIALVFSPTGLCLPRRERQAVPESLLQRCQKTEVQCGKIQRTQRRAGFGTLGFMKAVQFAV